MHYSNNMVFILICIMLLISCNKEQNVQGWNENKNYSNENALTINYEGQFREYLIYVPDSYDNTSSIPLVMSFHGGSDTAEGHMQMTDMQSISDTAGFLIVYPQGSLNNGVSHWNSMYYTEENKSNVNDIGFIEELIDTLYNNYNIDSTRLYAVGFSNGADFAFSLACYLNNTFAAIASVAGLMPEESEIHCNSSDTTGILIIHGTNDSARPYNGIDGWYLSVDNALNYWINYNNLDSNLSSNYINNDHSYQIEFYDYLDENDKIIVKLLKIINGGHYWFDIQHENNNLDQIIWKFLSKHSIITSNN